MKMENKNYATVVGRGLGISTKMSIEICSNIKGMKLESAKKLLEDISNQKRALKVRRFNFDLGHKKGRTGPGRYPVKASETFLKLLNTLEANAENKGMNTNLIITFAKADRADRRLRYGRKGRMKMKNTHVEIRAQETTNDRKADSGAKG